MSKKLLKSEQPQFNKAESSYLDRVRRSRKSSSGTQNFLYNVMILIIIRFSSVMSMVKK
jgi:hypothetical protein